MGINKDQVKGRVKEAKGAIKDADSRQARRQREAPGRGQGDKAVGKAIDAGRHPQGIKDA